MKTERHETESVSLAEASAEALARLLDPPAFPRIEREEWGVYLVAEKGTDYLIPDDPVKVLGLLQHLCGKRWVNRRFLDRAIAQIADAKGWNIHR